MRILFVIDSLIAAGAENLVFNFAIGMKKDGHDVTVLSLSKEKTFYFKELLKSGINTITLNTNNIYNPFNVIRLKNVFGNYDIIHAHLFPAIYWCSLAKKLSHKRIKLIITEHSNNNGRRRFSLFKLLEKYIYKTFDCVICISESTLINLKKWIGENVCKMRIIYNGIPINKFENAEPFDKSSLNIPTNGKLIIMVANFLESKDHLSLIKAMTLLPDNIYLLLIGDGKLKIRYLNMVNELNLEKRIHFLGARNDVPNLIAASDICVLSSNWEGFGLVAVEFMASSKPTIVTDIPGISEVVGDSAITFEKNNYIDLSKKIEKLLNDKLYYMEIATSCKLRAKKFDINSCIQEHINLYNELIQ